MKFNITYACLTHHIHNGLKDFPAMIFVNENMQATELTYGQLDDMSARFASSLLAHGVKPGDKILLRLTNIPAFPVAFFGAVRAGIIPVPSSPLLMPDEVDYLVKNSGAKVLVTEENLMHSYADTPNTRLPALIYLAFGTLPGAICMKSEIEERPPQTEIYPTDENDAAYLVYTSGTTGYPKGVLHAHRALKGRLPAALHWFCYQGPDRILHSGRFNWTYVLGTGMMDPLYQGKTVVVYEGQNDSENWLKIIQKFGCTIFIGVPTVFRQILQKTKANRDDVPSLRHAMCAGEHLSEEVLSGWISRFFMPVYEGLGMSECSYYISQNVTDPVQKNSAGKIQPGHTVVLLDENLQQVNPGDEGMLCIHKSDPGLFLGYLNDEQRPELNLSGDWFLTGDYARQDKDGNILFMGRRDEIIKSFGYRISPFEIERLFRDYEAIEDVVAFSEKISEEKTLVVLAVILKPNTATDIHFGKLISWAEKRLASYKLPKKIYVFDKFPRSPNGKVLRSKISGSPEIQMK